MRPDRIVVGEVRGGEALDMLQAMNTVPRWALPRHTQTHLEISCHVLRPWYLYWNGPSCQGNQIRLGTAIDLIVYQARFKDGSRKITAITEVAGMEGDIITLQDMFVFEEQGIGEDGKVIGTFKATGVIPKCLSRLNTSGAHIPRDLFV